MLLIGVAGVLILMYHLSSECDPLVASQSKYQHEYDRGGLEPGEPGHGANNRTLDSDRFWVDISV